MRPAELQSGFFPSGNSYQGFFKRNKFWQEYFFSSLLVSHGFSCANNVMACCCEMHIWFCVVADALPYHVDKCPHIVLYPVLLRIHFICNNIFCCLLHFICDFFGANSLVSQCSCKRNFHF